MIGVGRETGRIVSGIGTREAGFFDIVSIKNTPDEFLSSSLCADNSWIARILKNERHLQNLRET